MNGVLLFAHNNSHYDYYSMAKHCCERVKHFLNLSVTLVTDKETFNNDTNHNFDNILFVEPNFDNQIRNKTWINKGRHRAYELSPYDNTLLLDVDYVINSDQLLKVFDFVTDICAHNTVQYVNYYEYKQEFLSNYSHQTFWATVVCFKKTNKAKQVFDCMEMIENNYRHYGQIHNFIPNQYRNDYSLTLALDIVNGHLFNTHDVIPWNLLHVGKITNFYKNKDSKFCTDFTAIFEKNSYGKTRHEYITINDIDFHVLDKSKLMEML